MEPRGQWKDLHEIQDSFLPLPEPRRHHQLTRTSVYYPVAVHRTTPTHGAGLSRRVSVATTQDGGRAGDKGAWKKTRAKDDLANAAPPEATSGSAKSSNGIKTLPKRINKTTPPQSSRISGCTRRDVDRCSKKEDKCLRISTKRGILNIQHECQFKGRMWKTREKAAARMLTSPQKPAS